MKIDTKNKRILTIEDDDFVREIIVAFLEDAGFTVLQAANGRDGLEMFRREKPDLVLLDLRMPEMDGLEVLSHVTRDAPDTPAIVVSGMGTIGDAIKALRLGAWDYISKPIHDMAVLEHGINKALERAELIRVNRLYHEHLEEEVRKRTSELEKAYNNLQEEVEYRKEAEETVSKINLELTMLSDCIHAVVRATDEMELIREICRIIVEVGGYRTAWVGFVEGTDPKTLRPVAHYGCENEFFDSILLTCADTPGTETPFCRVLSTGKLLIHTGALADPEVNFCKDAFLNEKEGTIISLPLLNREKTFGILTVHAVELGSTEIRRLEEVANDLAYGTKALHTRMERDQATERLRDNVEKLQKALEGTVQVVASTVEVRDPYTAGHQRRVARLAKAIASEMGLSDNQVEGIYMAGVVHDLGKIYVPAEILSKPSRLSDIEFNLIRTHSRIGYDLLKPIEFPWPIADIVHQHHEKINGSGYPAGLAGEEILIEARIITVADVVEALASHRPYRPKRGIEKALEEISENRGKFYDPNVVDACLKLFREKGFAFEEQGGAGTFRDARGRG